MNRKGFNYYCACVNCNGQWREPILWPRVLSRAYSQKQQSQPCNPAKDVQNMLEGMIAKHANYIKWVGKGGVI